MSGREKRADRLSRAIDALADVVKYGHLQVAIDPAGMLETAAARIAELEAERDRAEAKVAEMEAQRDHLRREAADAKASSSR